MKRKEITKDKENDKNNNNKKIKMMMMMKLLIYRPRRNYTYIINVCLYKYLSDELSFYKAV
jgi:hypothetical protein